MGLFIRPNYCMCTLPQSNANLNNDLKTKKNDYQTSRRLEDGSTNSATIKITKPICKRCSNRKSKSCLVSREAREEYVARQWKAEEVTFECENDIYCAQTSSGTTNCAIISSSTRKRG